MNTLSRLLVIPALIAAVAVPALAAPNAKTNEASIKRNSTIAMQNRKMIMQNRTMHKQNRAMIMQNRRMMKAHGMMHSGMMQHNMMQHGMTPPMKKPHVVCRVHRSRLPNTGRRLFCGLALSAEPPQSTSEARGGGYWFQWYNNYRGASFAEW